MIHSKRPAGGNARQAWDVLAQRGVPIKSMWYWRSDCGNWWIAEYTDGETEEVSAEGFAWERDPATGNFRSKRKKKQ